MLLEIMDYDFRLIRGNFVIQIKDEWAWAIESSITDTETMINSIEN